MNYIATTWDWYAAFILLNIASTLVFLILIIGKDIKADFIQAASGGPAKLKPL